VTRFRSLALAAVLVVAHVGCNRDYPNPFEDQISTNVPTADAALVFTGNGWSDTAGTGSEAFSAAAAGSALTRLTFCNVPGRGCDVAEVVLAPDRRRAILRVLDTDTNADGVLSPDDGYSLVFVDLQRQAQATLVEASQKVTGLDWSPVQDLILYSAQGAGGEDLFRTDPVRPTSDNQQQTRNLTCLSAAEGAAIPCDPRVRERRPRIDPSGTIACYERIGADGKGQVWLFQNVNTIAQVTTGGAGTTPLTGTPYVVGSDADPVFSPDGTRVVFRRLVATGNGGRGSWNILTARVDGTDLRSIASGPRWRSAPDWGSDGAIAFAQIDPATGVPSVVSVDASGAGRRVLSLGAGFLLDAPRWLRPRG
jgi:WD40-like Beta Propeller Repeat